MNLLNKVDVYFDTSTSFFGTDYTDCTDKWNLIHTKTVLIRVIRA